MECTMEPISSCCQQKTFLDWKRRENGILWSLDFIQSTSKPTRKMLILPHIDLATETSMAKECHDHSPVANTLLWNEDVTRDYAMFMNGSKPWLKPIYLSQIYWYSTNQHNPRCWHVKSLFIAMTYLGWVGLIHLRFQISVLRSNCSTSKILSIEILKILILIAQLI